MYACEKMSFHLKITEMGGNYETLVDAVIRADQTNFKRQFCECHKSLFIFLNYISTVTKCTEHSCLNMEIGKRTIDEFRINEKKIFLFTLMPSTEAVKIEYYNTYINSTLAIPSVCFWYNTSASELFSPRVIMTHVTNRAHTS